VFLPGVAEIRAVQRLIQGDSSLHVLPLHGQLSGEEQSSVFKPAPRGKTKVVLATNVAETSITIPDITAVVDAGRVKETGYDPRNRMTRLAERWASLASQDQRRGRAGRVRPGICARLYPRSMRAQLDPQPTPEIRRCAVGGLCLQILLLGLGDPVPFLQQCVDPPAPAVIRQSMRLLRDMGAVAGGEPGNTGAEVVSLTPLGRHVARLPLDPQLAKALVLGCVLRCAGPVLTVAAGLAGRPVFRPPPPRGVADAAERRAAIDGARRSIATPGSDHMTLVEVHRRWKDCKGWSARRSLCEDFHLSMDAMNTLDDTRRDFAATLADLGFLRGGNSGRSYGRGEDWGKYGEDAPALNENSDDIDVVSAALCAGLYPNVAKVVYPARKYHKLPDGSAVPEPYEARDARYYTRFDPDAGKAVDSSSTGGHASSGAGDTHGGDGGGDGPGRVMTYDGVAQERVFPHPASVMFHQGELPSPWVVYFEKAATSKVFLRDATVVRPYALLMFGGEVGVMHEKGLLTVGEGTWAKFDAAPRVGVLVRGLRRALDDVLLRLFDAPGMLQSGSTAGGAVPVDGAAGVVHAIVLLLRGGGY